MAARDNSMHHLFFVAIRFIPFSGPDMTAAMVYSLEDMEI